MRYHLKMRTSHGSTIEAVYASELERAMVVIAWSGRCSDVETWETLEEEGN